MQNKFLILVLLLVLVAGGWYLLSAQTDSTPNSAENAPPGSIHNLPLPPAVQAVKTKVANDLNVPEGEVLIVTAYEREWTDSCLGLGGIAESCLQVITPGYEVTTEAGDETQTYRTNGDGSVIRLQS